MASLWARAIEAYGIHDARSFGRTPWIITSGTFLMGLGRGMVAPFLVLYLVQQQHLALSVVGLGIAAEFVVRAFVGPVAGGISDRFGRKPVMLAGLLGTSILLPSYLLVRNAPTFLVISVLNGMIAAHSLYGPASSALVTDVMPPHKRGAIFGLIHASRNLGWTFGIAAGAAMITRGFAPIFVAGGLLPFLFLFVVLFLVKEEPRAKRARFEPLADWSALWASGAFVSYLVLSIAFFLAWGTINSVFPLWIVDGLHLGEQAIAIIAINSALVFLFQLPFGRLADRLRRAMLLSLAALALALTYAIWAWAPALAIPVLVTVGVGVVAFTVAEMLFSPILSAYAADLAPPGAAGTALGVLAFATAIGQAVPPFLVDWMVPRWGWSAVWATLAALSVASAWGFVAFRRFVPAKIDRPTASP